MESSWVFRVGLFFQFTMETAVNNSLPFVGMVITKTDNHLNTSVYRKKNQQRAFNPSLEPCRQQV